MYKGDSRYHQGLSQRPKKIKDANRISAIAMERFEDLDLALQDDYGKYAKALAAEAVSGRPEGCSTPSLDKPKATRSKGVQTRPTPAEVGLRTSTQETATEIAAAINDGKGQKRRLNTSNSSNPSPEAGRVGKKPCPTQRTEVETTPATRQDAHADPWSKVVRRKKRQAPCTPTQQAPPPIPKATANPKTRNRPEAVIIKMNAPKEGETAETYADMLRRMKGTVNPAALGIKVRGLRHTRKGDYLVEMMPGEKGTDALAKAMADFLGDEASVKALKPTVHIEVCDIDEFTTTEDVSAALDGVLNAEDRPSVCIQKMRRAFRRTQIAVLVAPAEVATRLLAEETLRVGWVSCRLRPSESVTRCFRCLAYGHYARECKHPVDRSKWCLRCGKPDHLARTCVAAPMCIPCADAGLDAKHHIGGNQCALYRAEAKRSAWR